MTEITRIAAVLGRDVSASLSPHLHNAAARALSLPVAYVPLSCPAEADFDRRLDALGTLGAYGANVTIPYKTQAYARAASRSARAEALGVVNTLCFEEDGSLYGDNTDGAGLLRVLKTLPDACFEEVQLLGSGGAARAAAWALAERGAGRLVVCARSCFKGGEVAELFTPGAMCGPLGAGPRHPTLVISALPNTEEMAQAALSDWIEEKASPYVLDLAYGGLSKNSPLVAGAAARGWDGQDGLGMLVEQAALSLSIWTGAEAEAVRGPMWASVTPRGIASGADLG